MIRRAAIALALVLGATAFAAEASEPGRRRPVTNPQTIVDGVVASVTTEAFRVQTAAGSVTVMLTQSTEVMRNGAAPSSVTPALGDYTLTDALVARDGTVSARRVALFNVPASVAARETIRVEGKVAAVSQESSELKLETLGGELLTVSVNETTIIRRDGVVIGLGQIEIGSIARVVGKPTGERTLLALEIDIRTLPPPPHHDAVAGEVVEIRATERALVVRPALKGPRPSSDELAIVRTDDRTEIYRHRERIRFDEIAVGNFVFAQGELDSTKALLAARIDVADPPEPAPKLAGRVLELSSATRQFTMAVERGWMDGAPAGPVTVVVNDDTKIYRDREQVRFDSIRVGDYVVVAGQWRDDHALVANVIHIVTPPPVPPLPVILGEIVEIEPATHTLIVRVRATRPLETSTDGTVKVLVSDETEIFRNGEPSRFDELRTGDVAAIVGEVRDDGTLLAKRIDVFAPPTRPATVIGDVVAVGDRSIEIIVPQPYPTFQAVRVTILVDDATEIFRNGERVRLAAIQVEDMVFATGEWKDGSTLLARKIEAKARHSRPGPIISLRGKIESVAPGGIRVAVSDGQIWVVTISPMTMITRGGVPVQFESLLVGETVEVAGTSTADHTVAAMKIAVVGR